MKPPVKTLAILTIFFFSLTIAKAQIKLHSTNGIAADVKKVIDDYPSHFDNILGEIIVQNPQSTDYQCNFKVNGAEECFITKYSGKKDPVTSWQALMLTTDDFNEATKKFRALYNELNNLSKESMRLKGNYKAPAEEKKFTNVVFSFSPATEGLKKLKVELAMEAQGMDWKIKLLVYDHDKEDNEKGEIE
ncbi:MAG TPA: hypothetical protein VI461_07310 [Chitinophagaceae bacterium]|nr:hypothetical protein [Chitinophagaceae bacterium]